MKSFTRTTLFRSLVVVLLLATLAVAQTPFGNGRGAFRGSVYVPSVYSLIFGDNTSSDVYLAKNGSNVVGITGNIGGSGTTANTTTTPAGPYAWGSVALSSGTATVTFAKAFNATTTVCWGNWNGSGTYTTGATLKFVSNATQVVITSTTLTDTAVINWQCVGNPN